MRIDVVVDVVVEVVIVVDDVVTWQGERATNAVAVMIAAPPL